MPTTKNTTKNAAASGPATNAGAVEISDGTATVTRQPQSKEQAAKSAGMFLYTDDHWSQAYFNDKDLHCKERELFG